MQKAVNDVIDIFTSGYGKYNTGYFLVKHSYLYNKGIYYTLRHISIPKLVFDFSKSLLMVAITTSINNIMHEFWELMTYWLM